MKLLRRKIDNYLKEWKSDKERMPLIVKGARQVGKTASILQFAHDNYQNVVAINFVLQQKYKAIFEEGYEVDSIIRNLTLINPSLKIEAGNTLIFFDEMQDCPACATSLKAFKIDGRYDVICSGSLMGINYREIESNSVGYKEDYTMHSMDFEEFLWAKGYDSAFIERLYEKMVSITPLSNMEMDILEICARTRQRKNQERVRPYFCLPGTRQQEISDKQDCPWSKKQRIRWHHRMAS